MLAMPLAEICSAWKKTHLIYTHTHIPEDVFFVHNVLYVVIIINDDDFSII